MEGRKRVFLVVKIEYWFIEWDLNVALNLLSRVIAVLFLFLFLLLFSDFSFPIVLPGGGSV